MPRVAVVGDPCGGTIQNSQGISSDINGSPLAVIGDTITPHGRSPHASARIVSGGAIRIAGSRISRTGDYATCGHVIAASPVTEESSASWAPQPPRATTGSGMSTASGTIDVSWTQPESYPGHSGAIVQWKAPGEEYDESRQIVVPFGGGTTPTITGLTDGVLYTIRVITTRRFAEDAVVSDEFTAIPMDVPDDPNEP